MMNEEEFLKLLKAHDWYYMYSDDHSVWRRGQNERDVIMNAMRANPELGKIYQNFTKENV